eukprot:TRINITY_DN32071_c0_g1_i1.p2 TRINITY_DN32071_c0_g1~~TRINITY_DN32071_c0_g1_i1.p2  ORF type:complete len:623 (+),score=251.44 TRINITY_DN32071_c0_g1_i1:55-1869(+)
MPAPEPVSGESYEISLPGQPPEEKFQAFVSSCDDEGVDVKVDRMGDFSFTREYWRKKAFAKSPAALRRQLNELREQLRCGELAEDQHKRRAKELRREFYCGEPRYGADGCAASSAFELELREEKREARDSLRSESRRRMKSCTAAIRASGRFGLPVGSAYNAASSQREEGNIASMSTASPNFASPTGADGPPKTLVRRPWGECVRKSKLLGKGAFGKVWLGLREDTGGFVAMKEMSLGEGDEASRGKASAIAREIKVMKPLRHKNIVRFLHAERTQFADEHGLRIFMEYVPGGSLANIVEEYARPDTEQRGLAEPTVKSYIRQMLEGLAYLHEQGIVHRDIKGENALVGADGVVKVADFGTAASIDRGCRETCGTPCFMAPEVVKAPEDGSGHDGKADVWSVGCTAVQLLTGNPPFSHLDKYGAMFAVVKADPDDPPDASLKREELTEECRDFVEQCFERDRSLRPSAEQLLKHPWLADAADLDDDEAPRLTAPPPSITPGTTRPPSHAGTIPPSVDRRPVGSHDAVVDWRQHHRSQQRHMAAQHSLNHARPLAPPGSPTVDVKGDVDSMPERTDTKGFNPCTVGTVRAYDTDFEADAKKMLFG